MNLLLSGRFRFAISATIAVFVIGTIGYMAIEGWSFLDSLFMTAITISTVGYDEVGDLSSGGQIFSIVLIVVGVGITFYTIVLIAEYIAEGHLGSTIGRHRMKERIKKLQDHYIVCGYGRVGREVASTINDENEPYVIVEQKSDRIEMAIKDECLYIEGNVTDDEVLKEAGIEHARALIAAVGNDVDNVYVVLSAKALRPDIMIVARASDSDSERKLLRAGANRVIFPQKLGGRRMAMVTLHPQLIDFIDTTVSGRNGEYSLEDILITSDSPIAGMSLKEGQDLCCGGVIVAMKKKDGSLVANPQPDSVLEVGDEMLFIGTRQQLSVLDGSSN